MKLLAFATAILSIFLSAWATYPQSREEQATFHANAARAAISKGDNPDAAYQIGLALSHPK
jgi:hypothetical protein